MSSSKINTRQFKSQFEAVCHAYKCPPDEVKIMADSVRNDPVNAAISYGIMAKEIAA